MAQPTNPVADAHESAQFVARHTRTDLAQTLEHRAA